MATVVGIWALVFFVGVHTMSAMRLILVPLFWAFFLMMGLVPATDFVERILLRMTATCCGLKAKKRPDYVHVQEKLGPSAGEEDDEQPDCHQATVRSVAVMLVAIIFFGVVILFFVMIYVSAVHMQQNWHHYQDGMKRMTDLSKKLIQTYSKLLPPNVVDDISKKAVTGMEEVLSAALSFILEGVTGTLVEGLMMLLYMIFWLCQPMHVEKVVSGLFQQYILLKALASGGYALCVWLLLHFCNIDLAIVFGLITFLFNFVPEVGPFLAMGLPIPVVLFDGRLKQPLITLAVALGGNMALKCVWGNCIEVKLVESQRDFQLHPVVILFFVAFFGWIWGATGMLLSVPAVAVVKASMHLIPPAYRDPILIMLEGDRRAPSRYEKWRAESLSLSEVPSPSS